ncbi:hypothetical protein T492DRAFT_881211, partial [Pavlovales sp. CCMP2436]
MDVSMVHRHAMDVSMRRRVAPSDMVPTMRPAGTQMRYIAYQRTLSGLMPVAVPEGTTRIFVNTTTNKRHKAGRAEAGTGPSTSARGHDSPHVDDGEDAVYVFDDEEAPEEEGNQCGGSCGWSGGGGGNRRTIREQNIRWDEVSGLRVSSAFEREGAQVLFTLEPDNDDGAHSYFHTHPRLMCWGEQGCAASGGAGECAGGILGLEPYQFVEDTRLIFGAECATTDQMQTLFAVPLLAVWHERVNIAGNGLRGICDELQERANDTLARPVKRIS